MNDDKLNKVLDNTHKMMKIYLFQYLQFFKLRIIKLL